MMKYADIRESCLRANVRLPETGLVDLTFGNVSVLDAKAGVFAIKPSGVGYSGLRAQDMVVMDLDGNVLDGDLRPSSDEPTHRYLYRAFADKGVRSVVHTHSRNAVAFAQAGMPVPCLGTTHADSFRGAIPVTREMTEAEVRDHYEWNTGAVIAEAFASRDPLEVAAVLVRGHGPFAWGPDADKALENAFVLEVVSEMARHTYCINPDVIDLPIHVRDKHFLRKHGTNAYYGQG
jgi:L-ribulose-5-phosphate 4-epimerase